MSATITSSVASQMPSASSPASGNVPLEQTGYLSTTITSIIACLTPMLALMYLCMLSWTYRYAQRNPRTFSKASSMLLQRYTPIVYAFMVLSSLAEVAVASWLLLQYRFHQNFPAVKTRTGTQLLLFAACWTVLTAGAYTVLFLHPTWYRHQISSVGAQAIWILITWVLWVAGAAIVNGSIPSLMNKQNCTSLVYCQQIQTLFGISIVEILALTGAMVIIIWLAWQSTRGIIQPKAVGQ